MAPTDAVSQLLGASDESAASASASAAPSSAAAVAARQQRRLVTIGVCAATAAATTCCLWQFVAPGFRRHALPYLPATRRQLANAFALLNANGFVTRQATEPLRLVDLGSGDGRVVLYAATNLYRAYGVELNRVLLARARLSAVAKAFTSLPYRPAFYRQDLLQHAVDEYDVVMFFGVSGMMQEMEQKLQRELRPGACAVTCRFPLPTWRPADQVLDGHDSVWLYCKS